MVARLSAWKTASISPAASAWITHGKDNIRARQQVGKRIWPETTMGSRVLQETGPAARKFFNPAGRVICSKTSTEDTETH
jgi:hypothetical protein